MPKFTWLTIFFLCFFACKTKRTTEGQKPKKPIENLGDEDTKSGTNATPADSGNRSISGQGGSQTIVKKDLASEVDQQVSLKESISQIKQLQKVNQANKLLTNPDSLMQSNQLVIRESMQALIRLLRSHINHTVEERSGYLNKEHEKAIGHALSRLLVIQKKYFFEMSVNMVEQQEAEKLLAAINQVSGSKEQTDAEKKNSESAAAVFAMIDSALERVLAILTTTQGQKEVFNLCESSKQMQMSQTLVFPERTGCRFYKHLGRHNEHGNLERKEAHLQAREIDLEMVNLPKEAVMCSLKVASKSSQIRYDDFVILVLNGKVLLMSNADILPLLDNDAGVFLWSFDKVKGRPFAFEAESYCIGKKESCIIPPHDTPGALSFDFDTQQVVALVEKLKGDKKYEFMVVTTGDNDDKDCSHSKLEFELTINYVESASN